MGERIFKIVKPMPLCDCFDSGLARKRLGEQLPVGWIGLAWPILAAANDVRRLYLARVVRDDQGVGLALHQVTQCQTFAPNAGHVSQKLIDLKQRAQLAVNFFAITCCVVFHCNHLVMS